MERQRHQQNTGDKSKKNCVSLFMLGDMFDYVETKDKMMSSLNQFHTYYKKVKCSLKIDYVTEAIKKIVISIKKLEIVTHHNPMSVNTFVFLRDSIIEATNSGMKYGSIRVTTKMNINMS